MAVRYEISIHQNPDGTWYGIGLSEPWEKSKTLLTIPLPSREAVAEKLGLQLTSQMHDLSIVERSHGS